MHRGVPCLRPHCVHSPHGVQQERERSLWAKASFGIPQRLACEQEGGRVGGRREAGPSSVGVLGSVLCPRAPTGGSRRLEIQPALTRAGRGSPSSEILPRALGGLASMVAHPSPPTGQPGPVS